MKKYLKEIDILKGFAIMLVILGHSIITYPIDLCNKYGACGFLHYNLISPVHMPLFFIVSGYCCSLRGSVLSFYFKKVKRILIPYLVFSLVSFAVHYLFFKTGLANDASQPTLKSALISILNGDSLWFLYTLFCIFLVYPAFSLLLKNKPAGMITVVAAFIASVMITWPSFMSLDNFFHYLPYFLLGNFLKQFINYETLTDNMRANNRSKLICLAALIGWIALSYVRYAHPIDVMFASRLYDIAIALVAIIFWSVFASLIANTKLASVPTELGKYSLQLYLLNGYILTLSRHAIIKILHVSSPVIIIAGNFISIVLLGYLITRFIIKPVKLFRDLSGMV